MRLPQWASHRHRFCRFSGGLLEVLLSATLNADSDDAAALAGDLCCVLRHAEDHYRDLQHDT